VVGSVYKELTRSSAHQKGGTATITLQEGSDYLFDSPEAGIRFNIIPPAKRFRELSNLSGGEKSVAALALLFSMQACSPSPFFIMDEVDAALDNVNVHKIATFVRQRASGGADGESALQFIVISLKDSFYHRASGLVGIFRDSKSACSRCLTLDASKFADEGEEQAPSTPNDVPGTPQSASRARSGGVRE
jgi:structural maintenance of chromosome 1